MKKLVCAGEILVEIMAERIGQSLSSLDRWLALSRPARRPRHAIDGKASLIKRECQVELWRRSAGR